MTPQCPWRRAQIKSAQGTITNYGRRCVKTANHDGLHKTPPQSKQADTGVWFNVETGDTLTQYEEPING